MSKETNESKVALIKKEIDKQLSDSETLKSLLDTTFKGLEAPTMKRALLEGMIRGFSFENFLKKDVYAIPYGTTYSLVASIDHFRKIGMKSGVVGVSEPVYEMGIDGKTIEACSVTVKRRVSAQDIGEFTAKVYFKEYTTGKNLWTSKPRTMISKVAEMHAYRKACPEELAQVYVEEEIMRDAAPVATIDLAPYQTALAACETLEQLEHVWADIPGSAKVELKDKMEVLKTAFIKETADVV